MIDPFVTALVLGLLALAVGPLVLPWPAKLRWMVTAEAVNPLVAVANARRRRRTEEVVLVSVDEVVDGFVVVVEPDYPDGHQARRRLVGTPSSIAKVATLEGWYRNGTPLLLVDWAGLVATLQGPHAAITGLHDRDHDLALTWS